MNVSAMAFIDRSWAGAAMLIFYSARDMPHGASKVWMVRTRLAIWRRRTTGCT